MNCHYEDNKLIKCKKNKTKTSKNPFCQYCGGYLLPPPPIGVFGKFWDNGDEELESSWHYGYLEIMPTPTEYQPHDENFGYDNFKPGLPAKKVKWFE